MTFFARHSGMESDQRKAREIVIKCHFPTPARFIMAALAERTKLAFVRIIRLVTRDACRREFVLIEITLVAAFALCARMSPIERKYGGLCVIEVDRCPLG